MKKLILCTLVFLASLPINAQEVAFKEQKTELTDVQKQEIEKINLSWDQEIQKIKKDASLSPTEREAAINKSNETNQELINKISGKSGDATSPSSPEPSKAKINRSRSTIKSK
jgi:hypothetical protein